MAGTSNAPLNGGDRDPPPGGSKSSSYIDFWYDMFANNQDSCGPGLVSPAKQQWSSRRDYEWGDVLDKSSKTKRKRKKTYMGCRSSAVNSASDISEALSSISAALSLSLSADSSSNSSARGKNDPLKLALNIPNQDIEEIEFPILETWDLDTCSLSSDSDADEMLPSHVDGDELKLKSTFYASENKGFQVPELGMTFSSDEEAYDFYKRYAKQTGFRVRKGKVQRLADGTIRKRYFFCSRQGFRLAKQSNKVTKFKRKETRTGCDAQIQCIVKDGKWMISQVRLEHNHQLIDQRHVEGPCSKASDGSSSAAHIHRDSEPVNAENGAAKCEEFFSTSCTTCVCDKNMYDPQPDVSQSLMNCLKMFKERFTLLEESFEEHNTMIEYLKHLQHKQMIHESNICPGEFEAWLQNIIARIKLEQIETTCEQLTRCCKILTEEKEKLQEDVQNLKAPKTLEPLYLQFPAIPFPVVPSPAHEVTANTSSTLSQAKARVPPSLVNILQMCQAEAHKDAS